MWFKKDAIVIVTLLVYLNPVDGDGLTPELTPEYCQRIKNETKVERELMWKKCSYEWRPRYAGHWAMNLSCVRDFYNSTPWPTIRDCCEGYSGNDCTQRCLCHPNNTVECSKTDGRCECKPDFYGYRCERRCLGGLQACRLVDETTIRSYNNLVTGLACAVLALFTFSVFVFFKFNLKAKRLKKELKAISMKCAVDKGEFENPIYIVDSPSSLVDSLNSTNQQ